MKRIISLAATILMLMICMTAVVYAAALKAGDRGAQVIELQRILIAKGLLSGEADGVYGEKTVNAVKKFQSSQGLEADGICGEATFNLLLDTVDTTLDINDASIGGEEYVIKFGMKGDDVAELQNILIALGYMSGTADGVCGANTVNAIKRFQSSHGLIADGICGETTFDMINVDADAFMAGDRSVAVNGGGPSSTPASAGDVAVVGSVIKPGMHGEGVRDLQRKLIARGFLSGTADGICGEATVTAIKKFQSSQGLVADGIAGVVTLSRLNDNASAIEDYAAVVSGSDYAEIGSVIKPGMHGEGVRDVQQKLIEHGFLNGHADGICGARTVAAIKRFQSSVGLNPDGVCGLQTYAALEDADYNITDTSWNDTVDDMPTLGRSVYVEATAYSPFEGGTRTARGNVVRRGIIAVDPRYIPLGTRVYIPGYGEAVADDTGGAIKGNRIDIAFDTYDEAMRFGRQNIEIYILDN